VQSGEGGGLRIADVIRGWLGWCPATETRIRRETREPTENIDTPSQRSSLKARASDWLGLFRNQILLLAIWFSVVGLLFLLSIGNMNIELFFWGLLAGLLLSVFQGIRFWGTMNEVLENGAVFLSTLYDKTTIFITLAVCSIPLLLSLSASPVANMIIWNAVIAGFVFIMFWVQLFVVWVWEMRVDRHLQSDGLMLSIVKEK
jgi:hypothetical protein